MEIFVAAGLAPPNWPDGKLTVRVRVVAMNRVVAIGR
jgi:hypothetical protein